MPSNFDRCTSPRRRFNQNILRSVVMLQQCHCRNRNRGKLQNISPPSALFESSPFFTIHKRLLFLSHPRSEGWTHHGRTFSIYFCPLSFWLTLPQRVLSTTWCCLSRPCVVFLACVNLALLLALFLSPGNSLVSSFCDHSMLASSLFTQETQTQKWWTRLLKFEFCDFWDFFWNFQIDVSSVIRGVLGPKFLIGQELSRNL